MAVAFPHPRDNLHGCRLAGARRADTTSGYSAGQHQVPRELNLAGVERKTVVLFERGDRLIDCRGLGDHRHRFDDCAENFVFLGKDLRRGVLAVVKVAVDSFPVVVAQFLGKIFRTPGCDIDQVRADNALGKLRDSVLGFLPVGETKRLQVARNRGGDVVVGEVGALADHPVNHPTPMHVQGVIVDGSLSEKLRAGVIVRPADHGVNRC